MISIMIELGDGRWVNALDVTSIKADYVRNHIKIKMRDGVEYLVSPKYRQSVFDTAKEIVGHIDHAAATYSGKVEHGEPKFKPAGL
jgi:uncharacterized C2H2 Zn-finger protein